MSTAMGKGIFPKFAASASCLLFIVFIPAIASPKHSRMWPRREKLSGNEENVLAPAGQDQPVKIAFKTFPNGKECRQYYSRLLANLTTNQALNEVSTRQLC